MNFFTLELLLSGQFVWEVNFKVYSSGVQCSIFSLHVLLLLLHSASLNFEYFYIYSDWSKNKHLNKYKSKKKKILFRNIKSQHKQHSEQELAWCKGRKPIRIRACDSQASVAPPLSVARRRWRLRDSIDYLDAQSGPARACSENSITVAV